MTDINIKHPSGLPYIELLEQGRKISFQKDCFGKVRIYRSVNDEDSQLVISETRTPYIDSEAFPPQTKLSYTIELEQNNQVHKYNLEVRI